MSEIEPRIIKLVRDVLGTPKAEITAGSSIETVEEWDSLASVNILTAVASEFDIPLDIDDFDKFSSIASIIAVIELKTQ